MDKATTLASDSPTRKSERGKTGRDRKTATAPFSGGDGNGFRVSDMDLERSSGTNWTFVANWYEIKAIPSGSPNEGKSQKGRKQLYNKLLPRNYQLRKGCSGFRANKSNNQRLRNQSRPGLVWQFPSWLVRLVRGQDKDALVPLSREKAREAFQAYQERIKRHYDKLVPAKDVHSRRPGPCSPNSSPLWGPLLERQPSSSFMPFLILWKRNYSSLIKLTLGLAFFSSFSLAHFTQ
ncbi:hypothetical protein ACFE04_011451 [Oxalis oulophora]